MKGRFWLAIEDKLVRQFASEELSLSRASAALALHGYVRSRAAIACYASRNGITFNGECFHVKGTRWKGHVKRTKEELREQNRLKQQRYRERIRGGKHKPVSRQRWLLRKYETERKRRQRWTKTLPAISET